MYAHTLTHSLWLWPKRPHLSFSVAETSQAVMPRPKRQTDKSQRGGYFYFSSYVGSGPASTVHPKQISGILSTPNEYFNF